MALVGLDRLVILIYVQSLASTLFSTTHTHTHTSNDFAC